MNRAMYQALQQEAMLHQTLEETKEAIYRDILGEGPMKGVLLLPTEGGPICAVVSLKSLNQMNLSAEHYIPQAQAKVVRRKLEGAKSFTDLYNRLDEMVSTGIARNSGTDTSKLNRNSLPVLSPHVKVGVQHGPFQTEKPDYGSV